MGGVSYFGVVLDPVDSPCCVLDDRCGGIGSGGTNNESFGWVSDGIEVGHPHDVSCRDLSGQYLGRLDGEGKFCSAIFAATAPVDRSA